MFGGLGVVRAGVVRAGVVHRGKGLGVVRAWVVWFWGSVESVAHARWGPFSSSLKENRAQTQTAPVKVQNHVG